MMEGAEHSLHSSQREILIEHLFAGEVMRHLWLRGVYNLEVLKPQVDDSGYDLVLETASIVRHVQLKSTKRGSSLNHVNINLHLAQKPSGCVILIEFDPATLELGPFYWFGGPPGQRLPEISTFHAAKHTKGNAKGEKLERPNIRQIPRSKLERLDTIEQVVVELFGREPILGSQTRSA